MRHIPPFLVCLAFCASCSSGSDDGAGGSATGGQSNGTGGSGVGGTGVGGSGVGGNDVGSGGAASQGGWLTAYYPEWSANMPISELSLTGLTHVVHFGARPTQMAPYFDASKLDTQAADFVAKVHAAGGKAILNVGGVYGEQSTAMEYVFADEARGKEYATAVLAYVKQYGYDGVELDYEPLWNVDVEIKKATMSALARTLELGPSGDDGLSSFAGEMALAIGQKREVYTDEVVGYADQLNFMLYDMEIVASGYCNAGDGCPEDVIGYNSPLHAPDSQYAALSQYQRTLDKSDIEDFIESGVDPQKIGAGLPLYGYIYIGHSAPGEASSGTAPFYLGQPEVRLALANGGVQHRDDSAKVPWIGGTATGSFGNWQWTVNEGDTFYITHEDAESLGEKIAWAKSLNLGGVMLYDLYSGWDPQGTPKDALLKAAVASFESEF